MSKTTQTTFTDATIDTAMSVYMNAEYAMTPLDDVINVLTYTYLDFNLGNRELNEYEQAELLNNYKSLGSLIMVAINLLEKIRDDFEKCKPQKKAQTQSNPESAN